MCYYNDYKWEWKREVNLENRGEQRICEFWISSENPFGIAFLGGTKRETRLDLKGQKRRQSGWASFSFWFCYFL